MAWFPDLEFAGPIFAPRRAQLGDDAGMLRGKPVLKFVERFDRRENGGGDFNGFRFHVGSLTQFARIGKGIFRFMVFPAQFFTSAALTRISQLEEVTLRESLQTNATQLSVAIPDPAHSQDESCSIILGLSKQIRIAHRRVAIMIMIMIKIRRGSSQKSHASPRSDTV